MKKFNTQKGFSLVEVITGVVIIAIVSTASWMGVTVMTRSGDVAHHQGMAVNLIQKSQEELRQLASTDFDRMDQCKFPPDGAGEPDVLPCGVDISSEFPGFTRSVAFFYEKSSTEFKRAVVTVEWKDWDGKPRQLESVMLIARPPFPLPGNIAGKVYEIDVDGQVKLIVGARVTATLRASAKTESTDSLKDFKKDQQNYTLTREGAYILPPGEWELKATHPDYDDYVHSSYVDVFSDEETIVDILMERKEGATLTVRLYDTLNNVYVSFSNKKSAIRLYQNGDLIEPDSYDGEKLTHKFPPEEVGKMLTVATENAYLSGFAGNFSCLEGPSQYPDGWSSAIADDNGAVVKVEGVCADPKGNDQTDRITIEEKTVLVPLVPIKMATLKGYVKDDAGDPVAGAYIYVRWHDWVQWDPYPYKVRMDKDGNVLKDQDGKDIPVTNDKGEYEVPVPAEQELFPDTVNNYLLVRAYGKVPAQQCCDFNGSSWQYSADGDDADTSIWERVGPIKENAVIRKDFVINRVTTVTCGDVEGTVINDKTGASAAGVRVTISSNTTTDASGDYIYQCTPPACEEKPYYSIPVGKPTVTAATATGADAPDLNFYPYSSAGNTWYAPNPIEIKAGTLDNPFTTYNIRLRPKAKGTIQVFVKEKGTEEPINGINVQLVVLSDSKTKIDKLTAGDGEALFEEVLETWPPTNESLEGGYYNETPRAHTLVVSDPSEIYETVTRIIPELAADQTVTVTIYLDQRFHGGL